MYALHLMDAKKKSEQIVKVMSDRIATRSDYTKEFKDEFTDASGNKVTMTYVYQDIFVKLMGDIFSDKNSTFNTDEITARMNDLSDVMKHLASAQKENSDADYLEATRLLSDVLKSGDITITLNESEVFGLLKLAAPILVPLDELEQAGEAENAELVPFMTFAAQAKRLVVSHQFESSVVYLKELARGPELDSFDPQTGTPSAGASIKDTEEAIVKATVQKDAQDRSYVAGAAKFQTDDTEFAGNKVYYLEYTLTSIGHAVPDDFKLTIGTKTPIKPATVTYADGCYTMSAVFKFTIGTPKDVTLTYDSQGHGQAPDALKVPEGTILRYDQEMPDLGMVKEGSSSWSFKAWEATDGSGWDNITCNEDTTLKAIWLKVIDTVSFSYELPGKGETITISDIQLPEGAPYKVTEVKLMDGTWGDVDKVDEDGQYIIAINITPDDDTIVYSETDEFGYQNFIVRYMTNGQEREVDYETFDVYYTADDGYFGIQIFFTLSPEGIKEGRIHEDQE